MRELLESLAAGERTVDEVEAAIAGYATGETGRFDAARDRRTGVPEAILGAGKTTEEVASLASVAVETTGRAICTRVTEAMVAAVERTITDAYPEASVEHDHRSKTLVVKRPTFSEPELQASVGIVTAGTSDGGPAGEAAMIAREMGASVERIDDVGVACVTRTIDQLDRMLEQDVLVVAAGREGALPTVIAGLVDVPLIGLPVSNGYGFGGDGRAALSGMCQSCTPITLVNIDNGFAAGAQSGLICRAIDRSAEK